MIYPAANYNNAVTVAFSSKAVVVAENGGFLLHLSRAALEADASLVIDIYDLDNPVHPEGHLGWWQFELSDLDRELEGVLQIEGGEVSLELNGFAAVNSWHNDKNVAFDKLEINAVLRAGPTNAIIYLDKIPVFKSKEDEAAYRSSTPHDWKAGEFAYAWYIAPSDRRVWIISRNMFSGDAVGNYCLDIHRLCQQNDIQSRLCAEVFDLRLNSEIERYSAVFESDLKNDILFLCYSIYDPFLGDLIKLPFRRRICYQHGVTEPKMLQAFDPELSVACKRAIDQLPLLKGFDVLVANSRTTARVLSKSVGQGAGKMTIIPPRLVMQNAEIRTVPAKVTEQGARLLFVGRIKSHKKIEDVLFFFEEYLKRDPQAEMWIVGGGPNKAYYDYLQWVQSNRLSLFKDQVRWLGQVSDEELSKVYEGASAYISMSEDEGYCLPLVEAMAAGLPVFAYGIPAIREVLGGAGMVFMQKDYSHLADIVHETLTSARKLQYILNRQRDRVSELYEAMDGRAILGLFEKILFAAD